MFKQSKKKESALRSYMHAILQNLGKVSDARNETRKPVSKGKSKAFEEFLQRSWDKE